MALKVWWVLVLALATPVAADFRRDDSSCKRQVISGPPAGVIAGAGACHIVTDALTGLTYHFTGIPGSTSGWVQDTGQTTSTNPCGNGVVDQPAEQCDLGGSGAVGVCGTLGNCGTDCQCITAPTNCGNGVVDAGEQCDPLLDGTCTVGVCNSDCTCPGTCGDGTISPEKGEVCEPNGAGTSFGNALQTTPGSGAGGSARARDTAANSAMDFLTGDFTVEIWGVCEALPAAEALLVYNGGTGNTNAGWSFLFSAATGLPRVETSDGVSTTANGNGMTAISAGVAFKRAMVRSGTTVTFYSAAGTDTTYTSDGTATVLGTIGNSSQQMSIAGSAQGSNGFDSVCTFEEVRIYSAALDKATLDSRISAELSNPTQIANLALYLPFNEALGSGTTIDAVAGRTFALIQGTGTTPGSVAMAASPFGGGTTTVGCSAGQCCSSDCTSCGSCGGSTTIKYISPSGNNGNAGTSAAPWQTFAFAFGSSNPNRVRPGDTLRLKNGTYQNGSGQTGVLSLVGGSLATTIPPSTCDGAGANALCGTANAPITIEAENAGGATILGDGTGPAIDLRGMQYVKFQGWIVAKNVNNRAATGSGAHTVHLYRSDNIDLDKMIVKGTNRYLNVMSVEIEESSNIRLSEVNVYDHHRHGIAAFRSRFVDIDKSYANSQGAAMVSCSTNADCSTSYACSGGFCGGTQSREDFVLYGTSDSTVRNSAAENGGAGFQDHGGTTFDGQNGGSNNKFLNDIVYRGRYGFYIDGRDANTLGPRAITMQDALAVQIGESLPGGTGHFGNTHAFYARTAVGPTFTRCTAFDTNTNAGFVGDDDDPMNSDSIALACAQLTGGGTCNFTLNGFYASNNDGTSAVNGTGVSCTLSGTNVFTTQSETCTGSFSGTSACSSAIFALSGTNACVTHCQSGCASTTCQSASDNRCLYNSAGTKLTGGSNSTFVTATGNSTCATAANHPCKGAHVSVVNAPIVTGVNDGATDGWSLHTRLNILSGGTGCALTGADGIPCP